MTTLETNQSESTRLNNLNNRFVDFINLVKCETTRNDYLQLSLKEHKQNYVQNLKSQNLEYYNTLQSAKKSLNDLCLSVSTAQLKERNSKTVSEWYAKLIKFEEDNSRLNSFKPSEFSTSASFSSSGYFVNSCSSSSSSNTEYDHNELLCDQSNMSSSQTSLSSAYSSSSFIASTTSEEVNSSTETNEYLESYLSNVKYVRSQLEIDYERKYEKYLELKESVSHLNLNLNGLHDKLDEVKVDNLTLSQNVKNLRQEVEFYKTMNQFKQEQEPILDLKWLKTQMTQVKQETTDDFEQYHTEQINDYENYLEKDLWAEIHFNEAEYNKEADEFDAESEQILNELTELNQELSESVDEYLSLSETNQRLNDRLIQLSANICSFGDLDPEQQDNLILNYSVKNLERQITTIKTEIKEHKLELSNVKNTLIKKDISSLLDANQLASFDSNTTKQTDTQKFELKIRSYNSQIEYTKSNLFAYLIINFDVTRNYLVQPNLNLNFNNLRIVHDSIDGHNLVIENSHKILDLDLSEWTLRREIHNCVEFSSNEPISLSSNPDIIEFKFPKGFRMKRRKKINLIAAAKLQPKLKSTISCNSLNETSKKIKGKNSKIGSMMSLDMGAVAVPTITQTKCACCACKMLTTRKGGGDMDIFEAKEINSWGTGLLIVTKFINSKNIVKLINFKLLKHIWINNNNNN